MKNKTDVPPEPKFDQPIWAPPEPEPLVVHEKFNFFRKASPPTTHIDKSPPIDMGPIIVSKSRDPYLSYTGDNGAIYGGREFITKTIPINCSLCNKILGVVEIPYDVKASIILECPNCKSKMGYKHAPEQLKFKKGKKYI